MAKASKKSPEEKLRVVLSVLRGELSAAAAGRRAGVSEQTVHNWKKAFLEGARDRLALGARRRRGGEPPQPPDAPAPRQVRCDRRRSRGTGRAQRRRHRPTQSRRRAGGSNQDAARRPPIGDQGPHPGDQPDPRPDRHRPRRVERPAPRAAHRPLIDACARLRPNPTGHQVTAAAKQALRTLARRHRALSAEINELDAELLALCADANPALLAAPGVGPDTAATLLVTAGDNPQRMATNASFAALCGASPIEASSGQHTRHRLNRGGDRQANNALWRIAMVRLRYDERTIAYAQRRTAQGKTRREIIRCLKRHIAREIHQLLTDPPPVPRGAHLRHLRHNAGVTLADAARALNTCTTHISQLERGIRHNHNLATHYQNWLTQIAA